MKKGLSTSLPLIIYSSKHPFSIFLFPYNPSSPRLENNKNLRFVGQRAAKLIAVKVGGLMKKSATLAITAKGSTSSFGPDSSPLGVK